MNRKNTRPESSPLLKGVMTVLVALAMQGCGGEGGGGNVGGGVGGGFGTAGSLGAGGGSGTAGSGAGGGFIGIGGSGGKGGATAGGAGAAAGGTGATAGGTGATAGGTGATAGGAGSSVDCTPVVTELRGSGGCVLQLIGPANCAQIDFRTLGYVEFAWTTNSTFCEGPHRFLIGGHPSDTWVTANNGVLWRLTSTSGGEWSVGTGLLSTYAMTRNIGGYVHLRREDLAGITTTTGQYHWMVADYYDVNNGGSRTASRTFTIAP